MEGFSFISGHVKTIYQMITAGGDAELELKNNLDPFAEGILYQIRPPKKSWKHLSKCSGGERTLASLAIVFALHSFKPSPLYCLDELDAALDYRNVAIVAKYVAERASNCQFLVISHRNNMFDRAARLIGIYKVRDITSTVAVSPAALKKEIQMQQVMEEQKRQRLESSRKEGVAND